MLSRRRSRWSRVARRDAEDQTHDDRDQCEVEAHLHGGDEAGRVSVRRDVAEPHRRQHRHREVKRLRARHRAAECRRVGPRHREIDPREHDDKQREQGRERDDGVSHRLASGAGSSSTHARASREDADYRDHAPPHRRVRVRQHRDRVVDRRTTRSSRRRRTAAVSCDLARRVRPSAGMSLMSPPEVAPSHGWRGQCCRSG